MNSPQKDGFTLVELLIVISLVAILLVLSVSVVSKVRDTGKETLNIAGLKQIATAYLTYAADHNGQIPPTTQNLGGGVRGLFSTWGYNLWNTGSARLLFQKTKWRFGLGTQDYLGSPDVFYGPFTPLVNRERKSGEMWEYSNDVYRIGYIFFFLPDVDGSTPPRKATTDPATGRLVGNQNLATSHPRAPIFSDAFTQVQAEAIGFPLERRNFICVAHLDGSVDSVSKEGALKAKNIILYLAGLER